MRVSQVMLALFLISGCAQGQAGPGWYMIVPPLTEEGIADTSAPLARWQNVGSFGSRKNCETVLQQNQFGAGANFGPITQAQSYAQRNAVQVMSGQCISAGHPGLPAH